MGQFRGFTCDECGNVLSSDQRQKHTERFDGSVARGEITQDLCAECMKKKVPEGVELAPLRRRQSTKKAASAATS